MALQAGDTAPDCTARASQGSASSHAWIGDSWGVPFPHPEDCTPVCTTEGG